MKHFDVNIILPKELGKSHVRAALVNNLRSSDIAAVPSANESFDFKESQSNVSSFIHEWSKMIPKHHVSKDFIPLHIQRGILQKALPEDFYINQLPEKSMLPRGKCRTKELVSLYPKNSNINWGKCSEDLEVEIKFMPIGREVLK